MKTNTRCLCCISLGMGCDPLQASVSDFSEMPFNQCVTYKRHISAWETQNWREVCSFHPLLSDVCCHSTFIGRKCVRSYRSLDMSAQPSVSRSNDDAQVSIMPLAVRTSTDGVLHSLNKRAASMNHVLNPYQMYPSVLRTIRAMCEKPLSQKSACKIIKSTTTVKLFEDKCTFLLYFSFVFLFPALTPPHRCSSAKAKLKKTLNGHVSCKTSPNNNS